MIIIILLIFTLLGSNGLCYTEEYAYINKRIYDISIDSTKGSARLSEIVKERPALITFIYTRCPEACYVYLSKLSEFLKKRKVFYNVVVMSFDPRDSIEDMEKLADALGVEWIFGISKEIDELLKDVGFEYKKVDNFYDHPLLLVAVDSSLKIISRVSDFEGIDRIAQIEKDLKNEFTPRNKLTKGGLLSCLNYDPQTGSLKMGLGYLVILFPPVVSSILVIIISVVSRRL